MTVLVAVLEGERREGRGARKMSRVDGRRRIESRLSLPLASPPALMLQGGVQCHLCTQLRSQMPCLQNLQEQEEGHVEGREQRVRAVGVLWGQQGRPRKHLGW